MVVPGTLFTIVRDRHLLTNDWGSIVSIPKGDVVVFLNYAVSGDRYVRAFFLHEGVHVYEGASRRDPTESIECMLHVCFENMEEMCV